MEMIKIFKMLSDQTRVRIIMLLFKGSLCVCEMEEILSITQVNISRHLIKLKENKIVNTKRTSRRIYYYLSDHIKNDEIFQKFAILAIEEETLLINDQKKYNEHLNRTDKEYHCKDLTKGEKNEI